MAKGATKKGGKVTAKPAKAAPVHELPEDLADMPDEQLEALTARLIEVRVARLIEAQAPLRQEYFALMNKITEAVDPYGLTAARFLSMTPNEVHRHLVSFFQKQMSGAPAVAAARTLRVPPKYRHPEDPNLTWTGRGNKPAWVRDYLARGGTLDELVIRK